MTKTIKAAKISPIKASLGTPCIICDESVELTPNEEILLLRGHHIGSKVCEKCKATVLHMREQIKSEDTSHV